MRACPERSRGDGFAPKAAPTIIVLQAVEGPVLSEVEGKT
jgi:hypothetical protein